MPSFTFSLRTLLVVVTACAFGTFAYLNFPASKVTWESGLRDSEIQSASVEGFFTTEGQETHKLTKRDAIKFVRMLETCPITEFRQVLSSPIPSPPGNYPDMSEVTLKLTGNRSINLSLIFDLVRTPSELVDIGSKRDELNALLWQ